MHPSLESRIFGHLPDGQSVEAWSLRGTGGLEVEILTLGGIVTSILAPDRNGRLEDVVLGFSNLEGYLGDHPFFGALVGRVAGRITGASFTLNGETFPLPDNDPPNTLHGGPGAIDKQQWRATPVERPDSAPSLQLTIQSPEGENGFPGTVDISVVFTVTDANELIIESEASSSRSTPVSLTHHSYFNLSGGQKNNILDHFLQIDSDRSFLTDEKMALLNQSQSLDGQPGDFRESRRVGDALSEIWQQHGDLYWLGETEECREVAKLHDPLSGRKLTVSTDNPCLQMYAGVGLDSSLTGKHKHPYQPFAGLCLECQGYPNAIGDVAGPDFGNIVVLPDKPQRHKTVYSFSADPLK